jgi:GNAT acetyltransferase-like protein
MTFAIIPADNIKSWAQAGATTGATDVYFDPAYHQAYEFGNAQALAFVAETHGETLFFPFLLKPIATIGGVRISTQLSDIETVYGYSGPMATTSDAGFLDTAWRGFIDWAHEANAISAFIRFNPLQANERFAQQSIKIKAEQKTVLVRLVGSQADLMDSYSSNQRNRLRKSEAHSLTCRETTSLQGLEDFMAIYKETMLSVSASKYYFFPKTYFDALIGGVGDMARIFTVFAKDIPIATALFFFSKPYIHYHLGGSRRDHWHKAPNNLLFHTVALKGLQEGYSALHLGGGRTASSDDLLLRFKKRFSKHTLQFKTGRQVIDHDSYRDSCQLWDDQVMGHNGTGHFQRYRLPVHST